MFVSVSALNKRIEELENHKKYLLEKMKTQQTSIETKSDLDYLKTQGIDNVKNQGECD